jgi:hypothetical protein
MMTLYLNVCDEGPGMLACFHLIHLTFPGGGWTAV